MARPAWPARPLVVAAFALVTGAATVGPGARAGEGAFRCGTHLVELGDSRAVVRGACGEPLSARVVQTELRSARGARLHVERELWTYDFGPLAFKFSLTFSGDALESIERGDYGR